jgi:hypothetical protein
VYDTSGFLVALERHRLPGESLPECARRLVAVADAVLSRPPRLSQQEAVALLAATNGWLVTPDTAAYLVHEVADAVADGQLAGLDVDTDSLLARLQALSRCEVVALAWALRRAWARAGEGVDTLQALREAGVV